MARIKNIAGVRFGKLTVVALADKRGANGVYYWLCKCDCGKDHTVSATNLKNGSTRSCGCLRVESTMRNARLAHTARRKHFGCLYCGSDKHYAKGYCRSCYGKLLRGTLE